MRKKTLARVVLLFAGLLSLLSSSAQIRAVSGTVTDDKGAPLPAATVSVKATRISTRTDLTGKFTIQVPANKNTLVVSFVGMQSQELPIGQQTSMSIAMKATATTLNDVVVIGYGSQKKEDVNGAISSIKAADIANIPQSSIDQLLQGKVAGVTITQNSGAPGSNTSVHIRGITSLGLSNEPLYVIDGVPMSGDANNVASAGRPVSLSNAGQTGGLNGNNGETSVSPLSLIDPNDIESIDVLKDASATAIYGSQASNGVIIITTKRGKNGSAHLSYDGYYGITQQGKFLQMMNLKQYAAFQNILADRISVQRRGEFADPSLLGPGTDWQKEIFKTGNTQNHQISVSGGKDGVDYYLSGGYTDQKGTVIGPGGFKRYSIRANVDGMVRSWFKMGATLGAARTNQNQVLSDNGGIIYTALLSAPDQAVYNADGSFSGPQVGQVGGSINPVGQALSITNTLIRDNLNGNIYNEIKFCKDLTLRSELDGDFNYGNAHVFLPTYNYGPLYINGTAKLIEYPSNSSYYGWKEYLTYTHVFAEKHNLTLLAGHEVSVSSWGGTNVIGQGFLSNSVQTLNQAGSILPPGGNSEYKASAALESGFARGIYTYNDRYSLTATFRADKSSKFAPGHQSGYFPAFAAGWKISDELFFNGLKNTIDLLKLRVGYGEVGNQGIPNYRYGTTLSTFLTGIGSGFSFGNVANPNVSWETAVQTDFGLDFSILDNRIDGSVDYYSKTSKHFLFAASLPAFLLGQYGDGNAGVISPPYINGGQLDNSGYDITIHTKNIDHGDFKWSSTFILSHYNNKVISLANGTPYITGNITIGFLSFSPTRTQVGGPVGEFFGYKVAGIFKTGKQLADAPIQFGNPVGNPQLNGNASSTWLGDIQYVDINHDGKIDANDQEPLGNPNPKFVYSIGNNFSYKAFDLSLFLNGSYGAKIMNVLNYQIENLSGLYQNQLAAAANFWTPTNANSNIPAPRPGDNNNLLLSDRFLESGSYLRIQNVSLGYTLPVKYTSRLKINRLKVYVSGQNLYVFTPYKGLDPEIGAQNQNVFLSNVDLGRYPAPRTVTVGINAEF
jgi:TonB-linked SusC/RagA family outer membrane protein